MNGLRSNRYVLGPVALILALSLSGGRALGMADEGPSIEPIAQVRTVSASAYAFDQTSSDSDHGQDAATSFEPYVSSVGATAKMNSGFGSTSAYQDSTIAEQEILATGVVGFGIFLGPNSFASVLASSELEVRFSLARASVYTLDGSLSSEVGLARLTFSGPRGPLHEQSVLHQSVSVDESGSLPEGEYVLQLVSRVDVGGFGAIQFTGNATYDITLSFAPINLEAPGGEVPDGDDVVAGEPMTVGKLPGDLVRLTWGSSCRPADTDYAVYEGPIGDPLGFVPVTCSTGGQRVHDFAPSFDDAAFLVVPTDGVTEGAYGDTRDGDERPPSRAACLPQLLGEPVCP